MATFLEYYEREIMSRLTMADLILKTGQEPYDLTQMLSCLQLSKEQAEGLLETALVRGITRSQFLALLQKGDSVICRMFQRELSCGLPAAYTPAQISYIRFGAGGTGSGTDGTQSLSGEKPVPSVFCH